MTQGVFKDITGEVYGRLTVKGRGENIRGRPAWNCSCSCGNTKLVVGLNLAQGTTTSCGCYVKELSSEKFNKMHAKPEYVSAAQTHGKSYTATYRIYAGILKACYNPKLAIYKYYGGKGIAVCDAWLESYEAFLSDVGERPTPEHSLQRTRKEGNYEPGNVRWAQKSEQTQGRGKMSNNKSGVTGVSYNAGTGQWKATASNPLTKKLMIKCFSVSKYGNDEAFRLACEHRKFLEDLIATAVKDNKE